MTDLMVSEFRLRDAYNIYIYIYRAYVSCTHMHTHRHVYTCHMLARPPRCHVAALRHVTAW